MSQRSAKLFYFSALLAFALAGAARAQTVVAAYQSQMEIQSLAKLTENPTQMAWGPDQRLYFTTANGDVLSYAYDLNTGTLGDSKIAVPGIAGLGIAFHLQNMYVSTFDGILKLDDKNGNGIWGRRRPAS